MSEYQRYEFMTSDRPLTQIELKKVRGLSSHIEASSIHALIEYEWGDFKHDPIKVLHSYFDGFLYWANWGSPQLALRFPHGVLPENLLNDYDFDDCVTFILHSDYDILNIEFSELEGLDEWPDYELSPLMRIRDELMGGDLRALYIAWLAAQRIIGPYDREEDEDEDYEDDDLEEKENDDAGIPPVPPAFGNLTAAQQALAELLQVPQELLTAATAYSAKAVPMPKDEIETWLKQLPAERSYDYLLRLANNEPGLSRQFLHELRERNQRKSSTATSTGEQVPFKALLSDAKALKARKEREIREQQEAVRKKHLQEMYNDQETYWKQVDQAMERKSGTGYDEAVRVLVELRDAANQFQADQKFQERFVAWVQPHLRRRTLITRLQKRNFSLPKA